MVMGNHVIVGTGNDMDAPGFIKSLDPESGEQQWILYSTPQKAGDPGLETWASLDAAQHGGGNDLDSGLVRSGNSSVYLSARVTRHPPTRLAAATAITCSPVRCIAVNVDTGKMVWYYQTSPHDTHDWDSTETPILVDMPFHGRPRKLVLTATRNGYFFVLDRTTGEHLVTSKFGLVNNWASGVDPNSKLNLDAKGQPKRNPNKDATIAGSLVNGDVSNYPPPTFSPDTGLFYVHEQNSLRISYLMDPDPRGSMGLGGTGGGAGLSWGTFIDAIDYQTGKVVWRHEISGGSTGLLTTAGGVLFSSDGQNVVGWEAATGKPLWHSQIGGLSSPPETFMMDGKQHLLATGAAGLFLFVLN